MTSDDDPDKWLKNGPAAWFTIAAVVAIMVGAVAWSYGEFRADRAVREALALAADNATRESLRNELDLAAQQTMATAAIVATVLSTLSMVFVALTVWFTRDASVQARKSLALSQRALEETLGTSRRDLMPHLVPIPFSNDIAYDDDIIKNKIDEEISLYDIYIEIENYGKTPYYIKNIKTKYYSFTDLFGDYKEIKVQIRKLIPPEKKISHHISELPCRAAVLMRKHDIGLGMELTISGKDIFNNDRIDIFDFNILQTTDFNRMSENNQLPYILVF